MEPTPTVTRPQDSSPLRIPTDDPEAALQFCRHLARLVAQPAGGAGDNGAVQRQLHSAAPPLAAPPPLLSVVIPVHDEEENLPVLYRRLRAVLDAGEPAYEIVFVDDGSRDGSRGVLQSLVEADAHVVVVELARNFGHQIAISAGLDFAQGAGVIVMDADLQDPPEVLPQFIAKWREGYDVVYAIRQRRKEGPFKRAAYTFFYRLLQRIVAIQIPLDAGDFCLMDRRVVDLLVSMPERNRFVRGIRSWVGLKQTGLAYERSGRYAGTSKYTLNRLLILALDGLVSFSYVPLRIISILGFSVSAISILLAIFYIIKRLTVGLSPPGFASLIVAIFFLAGIQLITIGVIGEYVGRIFEEVKQRPLYIARRVLRGSEPTDHNHGQ